MSQLRIIMRKTPISPPQNWPGSHPQKPKPLSLRPLHPRKPQKLSRLRIRLNRLRSSRRKDLRVDHLFLMLFLMASKKFKEV